VKDPITAESDVSPRRAIVTVAAALLVVLGLVTLKPSVLATIAVIFAFFVMIMLHELGHYLTAKRTGMKVTEFFVGFGPRIWSFTRGETEYGIKAIPLGGYCRIIGMTNLEEVPPEDEDRTYRSKSYPARVLVAGAGSAVHFMIAIVLMFTVLAFGSIHQPSTTIDEVMKNEPAAAAGIRTGDRVQSIDGVTIRKWDDIPKVISKRGGETVSFVVERQVDGHGRFVTIPVTLAKVSDKGEKRGFAGIGPKVERVRTSVVEAAAETPGKVWEVGTESVGALGKMFSFSGISNYVSNIQGDKSADPNQRFLSPVGFGRVANQAVNDGWVTVLGLLIAINVFVGLFNLVPLLPFDGGHIAIATYERIATEVRGRKVQVDVAKLLPLTVVVIGVLGFIALSSIFLDVSRPIQNPF
jgi:membrane-associated protease RseP (regulator of RpoE activity)